ncbi:MAG: hypothetical protein HY865_00930 [Chloroflexi bacterium]|nr:hypothetical protein [Chloroflexota bacterium]
MNKGMILTVLLCCVYPVAFHLLATFGLKFIANRDWKNIRWDEVKFPWSKKE